MLSRPRQLLAAGLAIVLGVAFVTVTLQLSDSLNSTTRQAAAGTVGDAIVVVNRGSGPDGARIEQPVLAAFQAVSGVTRVRATIDSTLLMIRSGREEPLTARTQPSLSRLTTLVSGRLPTTEAEVLVNGAAAAAHNLQIGQPLQLRCGETGRLCAVTVVGIINPGTDVTPHPGEPELYASNTELQRLLGRDDYDHAYLRGPGDPTTVRDAVAALPVVAGKGFGIRTAAAEIARRADQYSAGLEVMTTGLLAFAAVALFVAAMVIANTFTILLAQRTRQLALLRCVGATRAQVFRSVLGEASLVATVAGLAGLLTGTLGALGLVFASQQGGAGAFAMQQLSLTPLNLGVPFLLGVVVALAAAALPALRATRIAPLAALRPTPATVAGSRPSVVRLGGAGVLVAGGTASLVAGAVNHRPEFGVAGGLVSFLGVMIAAPILVPGLAAAMGRLGGAQRRVTGRLAVENSRRNPARAAATAGALLIGVTLIVMMSVGAASIERTATGSIDQHYPADVQVATTAGDPISAAIVTRLRGLPEVAAVESIGTLDVTLDPSRTGGGQQVLGVGPDAVRVLHDPALVSGLADGVILLPPEAGIPAGQAVTLSRGGRRLVLTAQLNDRVSTPLVTLATLSRLDSRPATMLLVRFADRADPNVAVGAIRAALADSPSLMVGSAAGRRAELQQMIDLALLVVSGLLAVAVLIALVGVGNTLALSAFERTQESGLLRALGLTRGQVGAMYGVEALTLAAVAVVLGLGLGVGYGVAATHSLLGGETAILIQIPWERLAMAAGVALGAAWIASVGPALSASRVSPSAALTVE